MQLLHQRLQTAVGAWIAGGYPHPHYRALGEVLAWAQEPASSDFRLRPPQWRALSTYWYLRLVLKTPHMLDLYRQLFPILEEWQSALQLPRAAWLAAGKSQEKLVTALQEDDTFVARYQLESLRESTTLAYPSYILALAMGVGKTVLIGSIIASEFALALAYPTGPFVQNALVFAPGRTILTALRALIAIPYAAILPPHLHASFAATVKFTVTQDGERDIAVLDRSAFNVIMTNTEKIRIQKEKVRQRQIGATLPPDQMELAKQEIANLRLQKIASLPHLAIFSDEAHHTYGQALGSELKKVRKTVDYLASRTNVVCVINTTGTPYFKRQPLRDVVVWYGLAEGIRDGILKEVADNIVAYDLAQAATTAPESQTDLLLTEIIIDFFERYAHVQLADGTPAKLAIYFPQTTEVARARPALERALLRIGQAPALLLEHHTACENQHDFARFHTPLSPHRIALLVDRGVEGWDVPALFACALVRKLKSSNNFVLQAAARCLRQSPGNTMPARIYLASENQAILERQLRATYGETLDHLLRARTIPIARPTGSTEATPWPRAIVTQAHSSTHRVPLQLTLSRPATTPMTLTRTSYRLHETTLQERSTTTQALHAPTHLDRYSVAVALAGLYRLDLWLVYDALCAAYANEMLLSPQDLPHLCRQLEAQCYAIVTATRQPTAP